MPKRNTKGKQLDTISREGDLFQASFDLRKQDQFATSLGVQLIHYSAIPSPIGMKDKGGYRRVDGIDTISSNGFIYKKTGLFTATLISNSDRKKWSDGGMLDESTARLVMPRFYDIGKEEAADSSKRIYLSPGDRVYIADKDADVRVVNYEKVTYDPFNPNVTMFPVCDVEHVVDSQGRDFYVGIDFDINHLGEISWKPGGSNPGVDPDTKEGRVYSIRYKYRAFWYVVQLPSEVRITNVSTDGVRSPERMAYHAVIQREYVYQNKMSSSRSNLENKEPQRSVEPSKSNIGPNDNRVKVDMGDVDE